MLSVIIPAYNEGKMIFRAAETISELLKNAGIEYELIFIDDGSKDQTWEFICNVSNKNIKGVTFSRNFGKEAAILAGLYEAKGNCGVVIDCDLQQPPIKILEMYELWKQGYEVIEGIKSSRGRESISYRLASQCFYKLISNAIGIDMSCASDFKLLDRRAIEVLLTFTEKDIFFRALSSWIGFKTAKVTYDVQERKIGKSKWSKLSLVKYAISNITSFTTLPMQIVTFLGMLMMISSVALTGIAFYQKLIGTAVEGFTTIIILLCFVGSIIMISLGIVGYYIAKIYENIKKRPRFIISAKTNNK